MDEELNYGVSSRGKRTLIYKNFEFVHNRVTQAGITHWKCVHSYKYKCKAIVHTEGDNIIKYNDEHSHVVQPFLPEARRAVNEMKVGMKNPGATSKLVYSTKLQEVNENIKLLLPKKTSISRTLQRSKQKQMDAVPAIPNDTGFAIPEKYKNILFYDSGFNDPDRILLFGHEMLFNLLITHQNWLADGTFKVVPEIFFQLYTIHVQIETVAFPCVFALLPNKSEATYKRFLGIIKSRLPNLNPISCLLDFEKSAINAFQTEFPGIQTKGCFFHLNQSVIRKLGEIGLKREFDLNIENFAICVKMLTSTSLIPPEEVIDAFLEVANIFPNLGDRSEEFLQYFESTYIRGGELRNGRRRDPLFPPILWNHHLSAANGLARTTNSVEGFHYSLQALFQCAHPTMWKFLDGIVAEINLQHTYYLQHESGQRIPQRLKYKQIQQRTMRVVQNYTTENRMAYLRNMAHMF